MSSKRIKISGIADFSSIRKEVDSLNKTVQNAFGDGIEIIDQDGLETMRREVETAFSKMREQISKLTQEGKELQKQFKAATGDVAKQEELSKKLLENTSKRVDAEKEIFRLKQSKNTLETGLTPEQRKALDQEARRKEKEEQRQESVQERHSRGVSRGLTEVGRIGNRATSRLPVVGDAMEVGSGAIRSGHVAKSAGLGVGAIAGMATLAIAAGGAAVAISRMADGFEVYKQGLDNILKVTGMGTRTLAHDPVAAERARELGFDKLQLLEMQPQMMQAFGRGGVVENRNRMSNVLTASRGLGIDPSTIFAGANQLRSVGGTQGSVKQMGMILEKAVNSGMDKSQATSFLDASVGLLTELNQSGAMNSSALLGVLSELVSRGRMSPEQAARTLSGMSSAISGSSGEANAFFQASAARAGLGGGTLLGSTMAVRQGLVGVDAAALQNQVGDTKAGKAGLQLLKDLGLSDPNFPQRQAQGILDQLDKFAKGYGKEQMSARLGMVGSFFGAENPAERIKILAMLEKIAEKGMTPENQKLVEDLNKDPQDVWRTGVLESLNDIALHTAAVEAGLKNAKFDLGETASPIFNKLTETMTSLDHTLQEILSFMQNPAKGLANSLGLGGEKESIFDYLDRRPKADQTVTPVLPSGKQFEAGEIAEEQKKTNEILRAIHRNSVGRPPKVGRDTSRP